MAGVEWSEGSVLVVALSMEGASLFEAISDKVRSDTEEEESSELS